MGGGLIVLLPLFICHDPRLRYPHPGVSYAPDA